MVQLLVSRKDAKTPSLCAFAAWREITATIGKKVEDRRRPE
jgi:hypothetical protein